MMPSSDAAMAAPRYGLHVFGSAGPFKTKPEPTTRGFYAFHAENRKIADDSRLRHSSGALGVQAQETCTAKCHKKKSNAGLHASEILVFIPLMTQRVAHARSMSTSR